MSIKEKDLPIGASSGTGTYIRTLDGDGASQRTTFDIVKNAIVGQVANDIANEVTARQDADTALSNEIDTKVDAVTGKGLSTNDFTNALKTKLEGIESGAEVNVIETVKLNGTALTPDANKAVNVEVSIDVDSALSDSSTNPVQNKVIKGELDSLKDDIENIGAPKHTPRLYEENSYLYNIGALSVLSDASISAGALLKSVSLYASAAYSPGALYLIRKSDNVCVKTFALTISQGFNKINLNYLCEDEVRVGVYSLNLKYVNGSSVGSEYAFSSSGLTNVSPLQPSVNQTVTLSPAYSGKFAVSIQWETIDNYILQIEENAQDIDALQTAINLNYTAPTVYDDITDYTSDLNNVSAVSDKEIPAMSLIKTIEFYSSGTTVAGCGIFVLRKSDNVCLYRQLITGVTAGWNTINVNFYSEDACYIGQYGLGTMYTNSSVDSEHAFSTKVHSTTPVVPDVGGTPTITDYYSNNFALAFKWTVSSGLGSKAENNSNRIEQLEIGTIYDHSCIVCFIDDDSGKYVPSIWGSILTQAPIRMGFACITGYMAGLETPPEIYEQMSLQELQNLYNDGHEVYSHSYSHPAFYSSSTTTTEIERQCRLSKQWLESNGFTRNADIIVYPGGLGGTETAKQDVVRQFYRYGVDAYGGGINPEPLGNDWYIRRFNADTATLAELQAKVDDAITGNKLLVFMNHAYELNKDSANQISKMVSIINYIENQGGLIIPLEEALHRIYGW